MDETKLRERLSDLAGDVRPVGIVPDGIVPRAKRRAVLTSTASVLGVGAILAVSFAGVRTMMRAEPPEPLAPGPSPHVVSPKPNASHHGPGVTTTPSSEQSTAPSVVPEAPGNDRITVVLADGDVVAIDPDNEPPGYEALGLTDHAVPVAWAPDGRLAFTLDPGGGLFEMLPNGEITQLADGTIYGASSSPDGTELVYSTGTEGATSLHIVGGSAANVTHDEVLLDDGGAMWDLEPAWAPDGQTIAFLR